ncbi:hypothetical protein DM813_28295 [Pseudomonas alkylphenolica]|uniref:Uncharacterized protein n=1 Tax=Pseudomonas alkylphenolica TaxID=237609 RepID=A0A443ZEZ5_9PSED|nr:hypothetical protein [Pseudomonas alkylphenolica]RWU17259.1 hypothetical protein DM813_28295 [Pseudomonas alkylphenolica]
MLGEVLRDEVILAVWQRQLPAQIRDLGRAAMPGSGTRLSVSVTSKIPDVKEIITVLAARFIHDPGFQIQVNGTPLTLVKLEQLARTHALKLSAAWAIFGLIKLMNRSVQLVQL